MRIRQPYRHMVIEFVCALVCLIIIVVACKKIYNTYLINIGFLFSLRLLQFLLTLLYFGFLFFVFCTLFVFNYIYIGDTEIKLYFILHGKLNDFGKKIKIENIVSITKASEKSAGFLHKKFSYLINTKVESFQVTIKSAEKLCKLIDTRKMENDTLS